jgi:pimeloyl-ACP methyl ester carboxylesterase
MAGGGAITDLTLGRRGRRRFSMLAEARRGYPGYRQTPSGPGRPAEPRFARSRGFAIAYDDVGAGPPVVLLHGVTLSGGDWWETGYVDRLLAAGRRVLVVDPLGHGQSDAPADPTAYRYPEVALDVAAVMNAAGVDRAAVWGYSRGAVLAVSLAVEVPARVERLVLGGAGGIEHGPPPQLQDFHRGMLEGDWEAFWATPTGAGYADADRRYAEANFSIAAFGAAMASRRVFPYELRLDEITCPVLFYGGTEDDAGAAAATATVLGTELALVQDRDHDGAIWDVDAVWAHVEPFLLAGDAS